MAAISSFHKDSDVCSVVIKQNNKYLLIQEKNHPVTGKWNFPGGRLDKGESLQEAAIREAREESGYDVEIVRQLVGINRTQENLTLNAFLATIKGGELKIQESEIMNAGWFSYDEIMSMMSDLRDEEYIISALDALTNT